MAESVVYFIQSITGGPIKVGTAVNVEERLRKLQMGNWVRLRVVATMRGGRGEERAIHRAFSRARVHGEWFAPTAELMSWMGEHARKYVHPVEQARLTRAGAVLERAQRHKLFRAWVRAWKQIGEAHARAASMATRPTRTTPCSGCGMGIVHGVRGKVPKLCMVCDPPAEKVPLRNGNHERRGHWRHRFERALQDMRTTRESVRVSRREQATPSENVSLSGGR